ncbi:MAG: phage/plasmid primase, P4 family, partial [Chthoniobacterales bacterium]
VCRGSRKISIHVRKDKRTWFFTPRLTYIGEELTPLVTEGLSTASKVFISESQWDLFGTLDVTQGYKTDGVAGISTRGSGNAKLCADIIPESAEIIALVQNDRSGSEWLNNLVRTLGREIKVLRPPDGIHDINDWIKSEGGKEQLLKAVAGELSEQAPNLQTEHGSVLDEHATEQQLASLLKAELPPIRCVGEDWFVYQDGLWKKKSRDEFKPRALSIQNAKTRTARRASNVLNHIEFEQQSPTEEFRSFCCFDKSDAILINCANGVLRIAANGSEQLSHGPEHLFTGQLSGRYDPDATATTFERVLQEALPDPDDLDLFRMFSGYLLYPDCCFEAALVCYGPSGTGKSSLSQAIENVIGANLVRHLSLEQICNPQSKLLAQIQFCAVNIATELNTIQTVGGETLKQLVSGESVQADRKYLSDISLKTSCKFWFATNYLPRFQHGTDAELRRLRFLRFDKKPKAVDVGLKQKLIAERDGILLFMVDGLRVLMRRNEIPNGGQESLRTRERFNIQNDPLGAFVKAECALGPAREIQKTQLSGAYQGFCNRNGIPQLSDNSVFFKELLSRFQIRNVRRKDGDDRVQKVLGIDLRNGD